MGLEKENEELRIHKLQRNVSHPTKTNNNFDLTNNST
jgi:hypothetical protein